MINAAEIISAAFVISPFIVRLIYKIKKRKYKIMKKEKISKKSSSNCTKSIMHKMVKCTLKSDYFGAK